MHPKQYMKGKKKKRKRFPTATCCILYLLDIFTEVLIISPEFLKST